MFDAVAVCVFYETLHNYTSFLHSKITCNFIKITFHGYFFAGHATFFFHISQRVMVSFFSCPPNTQLYKLRQAYIIHLLAGTLIANFT